jgi:hypothetical protein
MGGDYEHVHISIERLQWNIPCRSVRDRQQWCGVGAYCQFLDPELVWWDNQCRHGELLAKRVRLGRFYF